MTRTKLPKPYIKYSFAITFAFVVSSLCFPTLLIAQSEQSENNFSTQIPIRFIPPDRGTPPSENGAGSRGTCPKKNMPMIPLVGANKNLHLTVNKYPTFWVYVPYARQDVTSGEFVLQDENGTNEFWKTTFILPEKPGVVSITLPRKEEPLASNITYRWYFDLNCLEKNASNQETEPSFVTGLIKLDSNSTLENQLSSESDSLKRVEIYARNGIWYDTITELAELRQKYPQDKNLQKIWIELLSDSENIGLEQFSQEPIMGPVIITNSPPE